MSYTNKRKSESLAEIHESISHASVNKKMTKQMFSETSTCKNNEKLSSNLNIKEEPLSCEESEDLYDQLQDTVIVKMESDDCIKSTELQSSTEMADLFPVSKESKPFVKNTMRKIVDEQKMALKFIQMALLKFKRVTDDLQELLENDIEEQIGYLSPVSHFIDCNQERVNNKKICPSTSRKRLKKSKVVHQASSSVNSKSTSIDSNADDRRRADSESETEAFENFTRAPSENSHFGLVDETQRLHEAETSCEVDVFQGLREIPEHSVLTPDINCDFETEESLVVPAKKRTSVGGEPEKSASTWRSRKRPCPYCGVLQAKLSRHLQLKHKHEPAVAHAINSPRDERVRLFSELRKLGIEQANERVLEDVRIQANEGVLEDARLQANGSIRKETRECITQQADYVMCPRCSGYYNRCKFKKHIIKCSENYPEQGWEYYSPDVVLQEL